MLMRKFLASQKLCVGGQLLTGIPFVSKRILLKSVPAVSG